MHKYIKNSKKSLRALNGAQQTQFALNQTMIYLKQNNQKKIWQTVEKLLLPVTISQAGCCKILSIKNIQHFPSSNPLE